MLDMISRMWLVADALNTNRGGPIDIIIIYIEFKFSQFLPPCSSPHGLHSDREACILWPFGVRPLVEREADAIPLLHDPLKDSFE